MYKRILGVLIVMIFAGQYVMSQNTISGNVTRENKKPLVGVKVSIEGVQNVSETTDASGNFDIDVPATAKILVFSFEGMKTQKIGIGKKTFISLTMIEGKDEEVKPNEKKDEKPKGNVKTDTKGNTTKGNPNKTVTPKTKENPKANKPKTKEKPDSTVKKEKVKPNTTKAAKPKGNSKEKPKQENKKKETDTTQVKEKPNKPSKPVQSKSNPKKK